LVRNREKRWHMKAKTPIVAEERGPAEDLTGGNEGERA